MQEGIDAVSGRMTALRHALDTVRTYLPPLPGQGWAPMQLPMLVVIVGTFVVLYAMLRYRPRHLSRLSRLLQRWIGVASLAVGACLVVASVLTALGPRQHLQEGVLEPGPATPWSVFYTAAQFFVLNADPSQYASDSWVCAGWWVTILAPLLFVLVAAQGIALLFRDSLTDVFLRNARNHVVVCGIGRIGHQLVQDLIADRKDRRRIVVVEADAENPLLPMLRENGVIVINGEAQRPDVLREARIGRADEVFIVTGSDEINVECVVEVRDQVGKDTTRRNPLRCYVHLRDRDLATSMRELLTKTRAGSANSTHHWQSWCPEWLTTLIARLRGLENPAPEPLKIEVFNSTERTVRLLFESLAEKAGGHLIPSKREHVAHFVIVGFGDFGQNLAVALAELAHFPNVKRARMTIYDPDIEAKEKSFRARYPRFTHEQAELASDEWKSGDSGGIDFVCNATFEPLVDVSDEKWVADLDKRLTKRNIKPIVFICFDQDSINFKVAERLKNGRDRLGHPHDPAGNSIQGYRLGFNRWPIYVWIPAQRELSELLLSHGENTTGGKRDPVPFGHCFGAVTYKEVTQSWVDHLAMLLHFGFEAKYAGQGEEVKTAWEKLRKDVRGLPGDPASPRGGRDSSRAAWQDHLNHARDVWARTKEFHRASNRSCAIHTILKLAALKLCVDSTINTKANGDQPAAGLLEDAKDLTPDWCELLSKMEHYRFCAERLLAGFSYSDEAKDAFWEFEKDKENQEKKKLYDDFKTRRRQHPMLKPYEDQVVQHEKDTFLVKTICALADDGRLFSCRKTPLSTTDNSPSPATSAEHAPSESAGIET